VSVELKEVGVGVLKVRCKYSSRARKQTRRVIGTILTRGVLSIAR
jgi:hypothetical protein